MSKKLFSFNYDYHKAEVVFEVDLEKFTPEYANETLGFFLWEYDEEEDPVYEVMKKYAMEVLKFVSEIGYHSLDSVKKDFSQEGFGTIDGQIGIILISYDAFEFNEDDLEMEVKDV